MPEHRQLSYHAAMHSQGPTLIATCLRHCHRLPAGSYHCLGLNPTRGMWESCQWLAVRQCFSLGFLTSYNWLVTTWPQYGKKSDEKQNSKSNKAIKQTKLCKFTLKQMPEHLLLFYNAAMHFEIPVCGLRLIMYLRMYHYNNLPYVSQRTV